MLQRVVRSTVIDAPVERVWAVLRDFNSHREWHSVVAQSEIERREASDQVGCVRNFTLKDGNHIREQLLTLDDDHCRSTYCILDATVPLSRYVATITLKPITDGQRTFWHWESTFETPRGRERELRELVAQGVYQTGFEDLRRHLRAGADLRSPGAAPMPRALPLPTRRAIVSAYGASDVLKMEDATCAEPSAGEIRLRQRAIGVNYFDVYLRKGWIPPMLKPGGAPGMEAAGSVIDVGQGVTGFMPDDRVAYLCPIPGSYASVRNVPASWVVRLPAAVNDDLAAATLLKGITADYLLRDLGHVRAGTRLLVHAASGGVGLLVCSWARRLGACVIGTVSSEDKARVAREYGCEHVIVTKDYQFAASVQREFGGADVIIDGLGDAAHDENFSALAACGHWISLGQATGALTPIDPNRLVTKSATFSRPVVFDFVATRERLSERAARVWAALADGTLKAPPIERHTLESAHAAHARLESRATIGSLVLIA
jgi:NADPH:quinone reductase